MSVQPHQADRLLCASVFLATAIFCGAFAVALPYSDGDWHTYGNVARNLLNGCGVAVSFTGTCQPHFGGAHLPLFPAFVAAVWWVFGESDNAIRVANVLVFALSNAVLCRAVLTATGSRAAAAAVGVLVSFSPMGARWFGTLLTEPLALAATTLVASELLLCLALGRVRFVRLALFTVLAVWVRLDGILLLVPIAATLWWALGWRLAMRHFLVVVAAIGVTTGSWALRNIHVGIRPFPTGWMLPDGTLGPFGYLAWFKTWVVTGESGSKLTYFAINQYGRIEVDESAFRRFDDRAEVNALLERLRAASGKPFPAEINDAFRALAEVRRAQFGPGDHAELYVRRAWDMAGPWIFPWVKADGTITARIPAGSFLRVAHFWVFVVAAIVAWRQRWRLGMMICGVAGLQFATRTLFFAATVGLESRYMVQVLPFLSIATGIVLAGPVLTMVRARMPGRPVRE
jgi:hypothetical protein